MTEIKEGMEFNVCEHCGACDGRAGMLIGSPSLLDGKRLCLNCRDTARSGDVTIHMYLPRSDEELEKTFSLARSKVVI
jgi:hypothetical protein